MGRLTDTSRHIEIDEEAARAARVPDDLDATQREPYTIPTTRRRRKAAAAYLVGAAFGAAAVFLGAPPGVMVITLSLVLLAAWHLASSWPIAILDPEALQAANRAIDFPVGHASAAVGFDGWRARPIWNVLVFSADDPPTRRGLVRVDAVDGHLVEQYSEEVPSTQ